MDEKIRVLIVDDHPLMRQALLRTLHGLTDIEVVGEGVDGVDAVEKARVLSPDVIIMDLGLPRMSGFEAISEITQTNPASRILVFTGISDAASVLKAVQAGAFGFLEKSNPEVDIAKAVRETYQGISTIKNDVIQNAPARRPNQKGRFIQKYYPGKRWKLR